MDTSLMEESWTNNDKKKPRTQQDLNPCLLDQELLLCCCVATHTLAESYFV